MEINNLNTWKGSNGVMGRRHSLPHGHEKDNLTHLDMNKIWWEFYHMADKGLLTWGRHMNSWVTSCMSANQAQQQSQQSFAHILHHHDTLSSFSWLNVCTHTSFCRQPFPFLFVGEFSPFGRFFYCFFFFFSNW